VRRLMTLVVLLLSCVSAALFVGVGVLFIRSAWYGDQVTHVAVVRPGEPEWWRAYKARSHQGRLFVSVLECDANAGVYDAADLGWRVRSERDARIGPPARRTALARLGFLYGREGGPAVNPWSHRFLYLPHWFVLIVLAACSVPIVNRLRRAVRARRRASAGQCPACGYDCRATPGRCPECGLAAQHHVGHPSFYLATSRPTPNVTNPPPMGIHR
jgi:hypothetical protein